MLRAFALAALATLALFAQPPGDPQPISFQSGVHRLHGCVWKPAGDGPFPVVVYNHGSEQNPRRCGPPDLARAYRDAGYLFFAFQRHGHGESPGEYIVDLQKKAFAEETNRADAQRRVIALHELYNKDVEAAIAWIKAFPSADANRIVVTGVSYGGIQTLLTAEKGLGIKAALPFAPAAMSWNPVLAERLKQAVKRAKVPIFLIQAQNDYSTLPTEVLGRELERKGKLNRSKLYPPFGQTNQEGHGAFAIRAAGIAIWWADVSRFLRDVL